MAINRFSFNETGNIENQEYRDYLGFCNRLSMRFESGRNQIVFQKGSLIYGFKSVNAGTHGFLIGNDEYLPITLSASDTGGRYYLTMDIDGNLGAEYWDYDNIKGIVEYECGPYVKGIGAGIPGIPWYTYKEKALIGKVFTKNNFLTGMVVCDDAYWCEFEGGF